MQILISIGNSIGFSPKKTNYYHPVLFLTVLCFLTFFDAYVKIESGYRMPIMELRTPFIC